jgi:hypothetical protein
LDGIPNINQPGIVLSGDAGLMFDNARGGNDTLIGANGFQSYNIVFGDAGSMYNDTHGGNDTLIGGAGHAINNLYGDAVSMYDDAHGSDITFMRQTCGRQGVDGPLQMAGVPYADTNRRVPVQDRAIRMRW